VQDWRKWVRELFGLEGRVSRGTYVVTGLVLMAVKYGVDANLVFLTSGELMTPLRYVSPVFVHRQEAARDNVWVLVVMAIWAVPFLWIGLSMSLRRALDAGYRPTVALWFLVPYANLALIAWLSFAPTREQPPRTRAAAWELDDMRTRILAVVAGVAVSVVLTVFSALVLESYGMALFVGVPVLIGFLTGWLANRREQRRLSETLGLAASTVVLSGVALLLFALEGVLCVALVAPLAIALALFGAVLGRAWARRVTPPGAAAALLLLPLLMGAEHRARGPAPVRTVATDVLIAAPPAVVWAQVIDFPPLPPPTDLVFRAGIAYPIRAEIHGRGVGAIRHCVFSTGPFIEPITAWEEPYRLAFDVTAQPPGMTETSPYNYVYAPHLDGFPESLRGEFRLVEQPDGSTRLTGTTWYRLDLFPQAYWTPVSDALIHLIHRRVLVHIKTLSE